MVEYSYTWVFIGLGYEGLGRGPQHTDMAWASSLRMGTRSDISPKSTWVSQPQAWASLV